MDSHVSKLALDSPHIILDIGSGSRRTSRLVILVVPVLYTYPNCK
jgi:hypothetical protein